MVLFPMKKSKNDKTILRRIIPCRKRKTNKALFINSLSTEKDNISTCAYIPYGKLYFKLYYILPFLYNVYFSYKFILPTLVINMI